MKNCVVNVEKSLTVANVKEVKRGKEKTERAYQSHRH